VEIVCCWADGKLSKKTSFIITTTIVTTFRAREDDREHARAKATAVGDRFVLQHQERKGEEVRHGGNTVYYSTILVLKLCLGRRNCFIHKKTIHERIKY
jgi:hypothetical protein